MSNKSVQAQLTENIKKICGEHGIAPIWLKDCGIDDRNRANKKQKKIWVRNIRDKGDYAAALHEIGHVIRDPDECDPLAVLNANLNAWKWARDNHGHEFDDKSWKRLHSSLSKYKADVSDLADAHEVHDLLKEAEEKVPSLKPVAPNLGTVRTSHLPKKDK